MFTYCNVCILSWSLWQVVGGSMLAERTASMEGICGWGPKDAPWEGRAFTGSLARGPHIPSRWPKSAYDQTLMPKASTEPQRLSLFWQCYGHFHKTLIKSNAQPKSEAHSQSICIIKLIACKQRFVGGRCWPNDFLKFAGPPRWCNHTTQVINLSGIIRQGQ